MYDTEVVAGCKKRQWEEQGLRETERVRETAPIKKGEREKKAQV